jgi:hypothetical protein
MSNDPLPSPEISVARTTDADYEAIYAELMATERGRAFLREYANRRRLPETNKLVAIIRRLDAAVHENSQPSLPPALAREIADLVSAIEQVEAAVSASARSLNDVHFAVERAQDIAVTLPGSGTEATMRETLDAAISEIVGAIVPHDAAIARSLGAAALAHELMRRVDDIIAHQVAAEPGFGARSPAGEMSAESIGERLDNTAGDSAAAHVAGMPRQRQRLPSPLPDPQAPVGVHNDPGESFAPASPPVPNPIEGQTTYANPIQRATSADALAALHALSEEEIIALFS